MSPPHARARGVVSQLQLQLLPRCRGGVAVAVSLWRRWAAAAGAADQSDDHTVKKRERRNERRRY